MERNVIQRPELIRRLTESLGMRQAHVLPTLNDGVQAVVILEDTTRLEPRTTFRHDFSGGHTRVGAAGANPFFNLNNPVDSSVLIRLHGFQITSNIPAGSVPGRPVRWGIGEGSVLGGPTSFGMPLHDDFSFAVAHTPQVSKGVVHDVTVNAAFIAALPVQSILLQNENPIYVDLRGALLYANSHFRVVVSDETANTYAVTFFWSEEPQPVNAAVS